MGRLFLIAIVAGLVYGGYAIYTNITALQDPDSLRSRYEPEGGTAEMSEGQDTGTEIKTPPRSTSSEVPERHEEKEPMPVVSISDEFIQVEGWGIVKAGDELPDGAVLQAWSEKDAIVTTADGTTEKRRFRRFAEAMRDLLPAMTAAADPVPIALPWSQSDQPQK